MKYLKALVYEEFQAKILSGHDEITEVESVPLASALDRICAQDVCSPINVPHFPRAMRDGYAVRAADTFGASNEHPLIFRLVEEIPAGAIPSSEIGELACCYVATGAMMPANADGVVMVEYTSMNGPSVIIKQAIPPTTWIVPVGKDISAGTPVLHSGAVLNAAKLGILAAIGMQEVLVFRRPRVGIFSSGNEILDARQPLDLGKVYDINAVTLTHSLMRAGAEVTTYGIIPDDRETIESVLQEALATQDVVISSGGTSKGKEDLMPQILANSSAVTLLLHGARIKPGKPIIYAKWRVPEGEKSIFVLPGNPTSCLMTYLFLVDPLIRWLTHLPSLVMKAQPARLTERVYSEQGRHEFKTVSIAWDELAGEFTATPIEKGSESITTLALADGVFEIEEMRSIVEEGEVVQIYLLP